MKRWRLLKRGFVNQTMSVRLAKIWLVGPNNIFCPWFLIISKIMSFGSLWISLFFPEVTLGQGHAVQCEGNKVAWEIYSCWIIKMYALYLQNRSAYKYRDWPYRKWQSKLFLNEYAFVQAEKRKATFKAPNGTESILPPFSRDVCLVVNIHISKWIIVSVWHYFNGLHIAIDTCKR